MNLNWITRMAGVVALLFVCDLRAAQVKDEIRILSLSPETSKTLRAGDTINLEIKVQAQVDSSATMRTLTVGAYRGRERREEILALWTEVVPKGQITRSFTAPIRIPPTGQISVQAVLGVGGRASLEKPGLASDLRTYSVVDASGKKINSTSQSNDKITITSISPAPGSTLKVGDSVSFDLKANYDLRSAETGRVIWAFANGDPMNVLSSEAVRKGKGTVSFTRTLQMRPGLWAEQVAFVFLQPKDSTFFTLDKKNFRVEQSTDNSQNSTSRITVDAAGEFEDHFKITPISPPIGATLRSGETIDFEVKVEYDINSVDLARIDLSFGMGATTQVFDARILERGRGSFTVTRRLWIPPDSRGSFPIRVGLAPPASAVDKVEYKVEPSQ